MNFQQIRDFVNPAVGQATGIEPVENLAMPVPTAHMMQSGGGGSITVDSELSATSTNPAENRVITAALNNVFADKYFTIRVESTESGLIIDKTFAEAVAAYNSGKLLQLFVFSDADGNSFGRLYNFAGFVSVEGDVIDSFIFASPLYIMDAADPHAMGESVKFTSDGQLIPTRYIVSVSILSD